MNLMEWGVKKSSQCDGRKNVSSENDECLNFQLLKHENLHSIYVKSENNF